MKLTTGFIVIMIFSSEVSCTLNQLQPTDVDVVHVHYPEDIYPFPNPNRLPNHHKYPCYRRKHEHVFSMNEQVFRPFYFPRQHESILYDDPIYNNMFPSQFPYPRDYDSKNIIGSPVNFPENPSYFNEISNNLDLLDTQIPTPPTSYNKKNNPFDYSDLELTNNYNPYNPVISYPKHKNNHINGKNINGDRSSDSPDINKSDDEDATNYVNENERNDSPNVGIFNTNYIKNPKTMHDNLNKQHFINRIPSNYYGYGPVTYDKNYFHNIQEDSYPIGNRPFNNYYEQDYYGNTNNGRQSNKFSNNFRTSDSLYDQNKEPNLQVSINDKKVVNNKNESKQTINVNTDQKIENKQNNTTTPPVTVNKNKTVTT